MESYIKPLEIRWSDLDPNFHLRHSVYYDFGASLRIQFLEEHGLTTAVMAKYKIGPILFREECVFKREIRLGDKVTIDVQILKARPDQSRWSFQHVIRKNGDEVAAILTVDGAWMDVVARKLTAPPELVQQLFEKMPRSEHFVWDK